MVSSPVFAVRLDSNQTIALLLASNSTGSVIKLNKVIKPNITIPIKSNSGNDFNSKTPANKTHCTHLDPKLTMGTMAERNWSQL